MEALVLLGELKSYYLKIKLIYILFNAAYEFSVKSQNTRLPLSGNRDTEIEIQDNIRFFGIGS